MKIYIKILFLVGFTMSSFAQITFKGCYGLFEEQDFIFTQVTTDATGRNVYATTPIEGDQECGGLGVCEFVIAWNDTNNVWEFIADDGNGDFSGAYVIYSNASASMPNPPSLLLGTWVENTDITSGECEGNLSTSNAILTGDVQDVVLGTAQFTLENKIKIYPNPVSNKLNIEHPGVLIESITLHNVLGTLVFKSENHEAIDVSKFQSGLYFVRVKTKDNEVIRKIVIE